jgi:DNA-3-methyladenine glycosylase I
MEHLNKAATEPIIRCEWCGSDELYISYHDSEWGVPLHDDQKMFELLILEGAQAGLSWLTVLKKRQTYRQAYWQFAIEKVAGFKQQQIDDLLTNPGIIRNKLKVQASVANAQVALQLQKEFGSLDDYFWNYVEYKPLRHAYTSMNELPSVNDIAVQLSKDLKKRGMNFVGPTIIYSFMQASGMINDHIISCFRYYGLTA